MFGKKTLIISTIILFFCFLSVGYFRIKKSSPKELKRLKIDGVEILVEVADTPEKREKGLSGRDFLPENQGMLFVFERPDYWGFWMKEMKFPLDFIWIKDNKVVEITENVKPQDFQPPKVLQPKTPVGKVLEVNGGFVEKYGIKVDDEVKYKLLN